MRLAALTESVTHVSCRYRLASLTGALKSRGIELTPLARPRTLFGRLKLYSQLKAYDGVVLQRLLLPRLELARLRRLTPLLAFDFDDAVWQRDSYQAHRSVSHKRARRFRAVVQSADVVLAGNGYLADRAAGCPRVVVVPTVVDPGRYPLASHTRTGGDVRLVWIGSRSTLRGLEDLRPHFALLAARFPGLTLRLISDAGLTVDGLKVELVPWSEDTEATQLAEADIGISHLPDDDWSRGKCGLKLVQYLAAGLPVVANPVGVQPEVLASAGRSATTPEDWLGAIQSLALDPAERSRLGRIGRLRVERDYSVFRAAELWAGAFSAPPARR